MTRYAEGTQVSVERSRTELERLLVAHGATGFVFGWDDQQAVYRIMFRMADRMVRFTIPRADPDHPDHRLTPTGRRRTATQAREQAGAEERRRWRALVLVVKARLVAVADGVQTMEQAFLADVVLPDGSTVSEWLGPQLDTAYSSAQMPALLPGGARPALPAGRP